MQASPHPPCPCPRAHPAPAISCLGPHPQVLGAGKSTACRCDASVLRPSSQGDTRGYHRATSLGKPSFVGFLWESPQRCPSPSAGHRQQAARGATAWSPRPARGLDGREAHRAPLQARAPASTFWSGSRVPLAEERSCLLLVLFCVCFSWSPLSRRCCHGNHQRR